MLAAVPAGATKVCQGASQLPKTLARDLRSPEKDIDDPEEGDRGGLCGAFAEHLPRGARYRACGPGFPARVAASTRFGAALQRLVGDGGVLREQVCELQGVLLSVKPVSRVAALTLTSRR